MLNESEARAGIVQVGRSLFERGLTHGATGNISARLPDGHFLVTPTGRPLGSLKPAELSLIDGEGRHVSGLAPTKELALHLAVYRARADRANAIVHLHATHSVAISLLPETDPENVLQPLTAYGVMRAGGTLLVPYFRPGDPDAGELIAPFAARSPILLLAHHGPLVAGPSLCAACDAVEELENSARLQLLVRGLNARTLSPRQINELVEAFALAPRLRSIASAEVKPT